MKFGKRIKEQIQESLPEWRDKFLRYKELKNLISPPVPVESIFVGLLNVEINKFNAFFVEQEEDFIIHHKVLFFFFFFKNKEIRVYRVNSNRLDSLQSVLSFKPITDLAFPSFQNVGEINRFYWLVNIITINVISI